MRAASVKPVRCAIYTRVSTEHGLDQEFNSLDPIMDRALFEAVRQKSLAQWSHRTVVRNKSDHLLTGLLFDDAGHRMIPTHATKVGIRYRYYVSAPFLHGEAKTASAGSISRVPAVDIEDVVIKSLKEHLAARQDKATTN